MKKTILLVLFALACCRVSIAQNKKELTLDERSRIKFAMHLLTYDTISRFTSAKGEAVYQILWANFQETQSLPKQNLSDLSEHDKVLIQEQVDRLNKLSDAPPSWSDLILQEEKFLLWKDRLTRRHSKYQE